MSDSFQIKHVKALLRFLAQSPVLEAWFVQGHEVDLTGRARSDGGEEDFVIAFAQEFQLLRFLVHEDTIQMTCLSSSNLNSLLAPAHDLPSADESCEEREKN